MYHKTVWHFVSKEHLDKVCVLCHRAHHLQFYFQMFWDCAVSTIIILIDCATGLLQNLIYVPSLSIEETIEQV
jgi:hypothetical protein